MMMNAKRSHFAMEERDTSLVCLAGGQEDAASGTACAVTEMCADMVDVFRGRCDTIPLMLKHFLPSRKKTVFHNTPETTCENVSESDTPMFCLMSYEKLIIVCFL